MLTFLFCNTIPGGVQIVKYFFSRISTSRNNNTQKLVEFGFLAFLPDFFLYFALKYYGTLKIFLLSAQNNAYVILSSYVEGHVRKKSSLNFMSPVGFQASKI